MGHRHTGVNRGKAKSKRYFLRRFLKFDDDDDDDDDDGGGGDDDNDDDDDDNNDAGDDEQFAFSLWVEIMALVLREMTAIVECQHHPQNEWVMTWYQPPAISLS